MVAHHHQTSSFSNKALKERERKKKERERGVMGMNGGNFSLLHLKVKKIEEEEDWRVRGRWRLNGEERRGLGLREMELKPIRLHFNAF